MKKKLLPFFIILFCLQFAYSESPEKKTYLTNHINPHAPVIDGKLDDPVWDKVLWAGDFIQRREQMDKSIIIIAAGLSGS